MRLAVVSRKIHSFFALSDPTKGIQALARGWILLECRLQNDGSFENQEGDELSRFGSGPFWGIPSVAIAQTAGLF